MTLGEILVAKPLTRYWILQLFLIAAQIENQLQSAPYKTQRKKNHILRYKMKSKEDPAPCNRLFEHPPCHSSQGHPCCCAATHASCAEALQARTRCTHEQNVCSLSNITSHRNRFAVREAFRRHCHDKEVPNKTTGCNVFWRLLILQIESKSNLFFLLYWCHQNIQTLL
jgi:hypothetical protein